MKYAPATTCGLAIGAGTVLFPLLALEAGHSAEHIGWFAGAGAFAHMLARAFLGALLRRFPDRMLITFSMIGMLTSFLVVAGSRSGLAFVAAMSLEGAARSFFWTGIQTHVVRGEENLGSNLAKVMVAGNAGLVASPALVGVLLHASSALALGLGVACSILALAFSLRMRRWPPFEPSVDPNRIRVWKRQPVVVGAVATGVAGSWRGLLGSYVPVAMIAGGQSQAAVGLAVALASGANMVSTLVLVRWQPRRPDRLVAVCCAAAGVGMGLLGFVAESAIAVIACLVLSGYGTGLLQVVGSSIAVQGVDREERGDVLALTGIVRAGSTMVSPVAVAAMLPAMPLAAALAVVGAVLTIPGPALLVRRTRR